jgi:hypothetical protein
MRATHPDVPDWLVPGFDYFDPSEAFDAHFHFVFCVKSEIPTSSGPFPASFGVFEGDPVQAQPAKD